MPKVNYTSFFSGDVINHDAYMLVKDNTRSAINQKLDPDFPYYYDYDTMSEFVKLYTKMYLADLQSELDQITVDLTHLRQMFVEHLSIVVNGGKAFDSVQMAILNEMMDIVLGNPEIFTGDFSYSLKQIVNNKVIELFKLLSSDEMAASYVCNDNVISNVFGEAYKYSYSSDISGIVSRMAETVRNSYSDCGDRNYYSYISTNFLCVGNLMRLERLIFKMISENTSSTLMLICAKIEHQGKNLMINYYPVKKNKDGASSQFSIASKTVSIKPGRFLLKVFPWLASHDVLLTGFTELLTKVFVSEGELFIHHGDTRQHFRHAYMGKQNKPRTTPNIGGNLKALYTSCMRYPVKSVAEPEVFGDEFFRKQSEAGLNVFSDNLVDSGVHPAEYFASGSYMIAYVSNSPDPFDPDACIFARQVLMKIELVPDGFPYDKFLTPSENGGYFVQHRLYTNNDVATKMLQKYVLDTFGASRDDGTKVLLEFNSWNPQIIMKSYLRPGRRMPRNFMNLVESLPKLILFKTDGSGKQLTVGDIRNSYTREETVVACPYNDFNGVGGTMTVMSHESSPSNYKSSDYNSPSCRKIPASVPDDTPMVAINIEYPDDTMKFNRLMYSSYRGFSMFTHRTILDAIDIFNNSRRISSSDATKVALIDLDNNVTFGFTHGGRYRNGDTVYGCINNRPYVLSYLEVVGKAIIIAVEIDRDDVDNYNPTAVSFDIVATSLPTSSNRLSAMMVGSTHAVYGINSKEQANVVWNIVTSTIADGNYVVRSTDVTYDGRDNPIFTLLVTRDENTYERVQQIMSAQEVTEINMNASFVGMLDDDTDQAQEG